MHDPNRKEDRGDPNVDDDSQAEVVWIQEERAAERRPDNSRHDIEEAEPSDFGSPTWTGSNPGLTGDDPTNTGGTADAGSGRPGIER